MKSHWGSLFAGLLLLLATQGAVAQTDLLEEARKHMVRGSAAVEMAIASKSQADLKDAAQEFRKATELAPEMALAWFNLAAIEAKLNNYPQAIAAYRKYLELKPNAEDAQKIKDEIIKLEYRHDRTTRAKARAGVWIGPDGMPYLLVADGNRITVSTDRQFVGGDDQKWVGSMWGAWKKERTASLDPIIFRLEGGGLKLKGVWLRPTVKRFDCEFPEETGDLAGEFNDSSRTLTLRYERTRLQANRSESGWSPTSTCNKVTPLGKRAVDLTLRGPAPRGGLGVLMDGVTSYWAGGFSDIVVGWSGRLIVERVLGNSGAAVAGLRDKDEILEIDGVAVKGLTAQEAIWRLRGEAGTEIGLTILRGGETLPIQLKRSELPPFKPGPGLPWRQMTLDRVVT